MLGPASVGAVVHRDCDRDSQRRGLRDDQQPNQSAWPPGTPPRFASGHDDVGIHIACTVAHLIIAGGRAGDVNRGAAGTTIKPGVPIVAGEVGYADPVATPSFPQVVLRNGVVVGDPLSAVLGLLKGPWHFDVSDPSRSASFGEADLRLANRGGARISAAEIEAVLERRHAIEPALQAIALDASLAGGASSVPWLPLRQLFDAFAGIRGIGFAKMTKTLHPKRPALIPLLDSVVRKYLEDDDLGAKALFGERALLLVRGYERDLDRNGPAVRAVRQELARRDFRLTEVRILDLLIFSATASPRGSGRHDGRAAEAPQITPIQEF